MFILKINRNLIKKHSNTTYTFHSQGLFTSRIFTKPVLLIHTYSLNGISSEFTFHVLQKWFKTKVSKDQNPL